MKETKAAYGTIDEYISAFPGDIQDQLQSIRRVIREAAPEAKEKISYQMPTYDLYGNLVHFAAFKNHIGFYPAPEGIAAFEDEVKPYHKAKGTLQFPLHQPLPHDLISRIVKFRVERNLEKAAAKTKKKR